MDFDFENMGDEFENEPQNASGDAPKNKGDDFQYIDISSNSAESELQADTAGTEDIMSHSSKTLKDKTDKNGKKKKNKKRIIINSVTSVILAVCVMLTTVMGWYVSNADTSLQKIPILRWLFGAAKYGDISYDDANKTESGDFEKLMKSISSDVTYFLVVGCDWTDSKQTDVIVVVCMDHKNNRVSMLQIPRDTYVNGSSDNKINSVYNSARQGELKINALRRCLSSQLGIPIDHYILFSIEGAVNVVDAVGGVTMNFKNKIKIENPLKFGKYYTIGPGKVKMSGKDAIGFMRKRMGNQSEDENYDGSDIGRVKQQRKFYAALFKELMNMSTTEVWKIANSCFNQVQTDLTLNETVAYTLAAKNLKMEDIHIFGLPGQACSYGLSYYSVHKDDYVTCFNTYFNPYGTPITEEEITIPEIYKIAGYAKNDYWMSTDDSTLKDY